MGSPAQTQTLITKQSGSVGLPVSCDTCVLDISIFQGKNFKRKKTAPKPRVELKRINLGITFTPCPQFSENSFN